MDEINQLHAEKSILEAVDRGEFASQREISSAIGLSLGKTHYLLKALGERGLVKASNFRRSRNKLGYVYLLTPAGVKEKVLITKRFLAAKEKEYEKLQREIEILREQVKETELLGKARPWLRSILQ